MCVCPPLRGCTVITQSGDVEVSVSVCVSSQESVGPLKGCTVVTQSGDVEVSVCVSPSQRLDSCNTVRRCRVGCVCWFRVSLLIELRCG